MKKNSLLLLVFLSLTFLNACKQQKVDITYVRSTMWQWNKGFKIGDGDFVEFDTTHFYTIFHDTIFRKGIPRCIILGVDKEKQYMKVQSLDGKTGYYDDSEQFTGK